MNENPEQMCVVAQFCAGTSESVHVRVSWTTLRALLWRVAAWNKKGIWKGQKGNTQKYKVVLLFPHHSLHWCQVLAYMQYIYWGQEESPMGKTQVTRSATRRVTTSTYEQDQHQKCSTTTPLRQQGKPMGKTTYKTQVTRPATRRVTNHKWRSQRPQTAPPNSSHKVSSHPLFFKAIIFFDHILAVSSSQ